MLSQWKSNSSLAKYKFFKTQPTYSNQLELLKYLQLLCYTLSVCHDVISQATLDTFKMR